MKKLRSILIVSLLIVAMVTLLSGCGTKNKVIKIGHKNFTEQRILGQMFAVLIEENLGYQTDVTEFGGTNIAFEALKTGEIDMYPDYTGTAYGAILGLDELKDPQAVYDYVKETYKNDFNIIWLNQLGFNNTYTFAVVPEVAEEYNLKTFSDLSKVANQLTMVSTTEFLERSDGLPGVAEVYGGFNFLNTVSMDPGLRYAAIAERQGDVMDAFSTDGKLIEFDLVVLEDDKSFFPPYYVAPLLNGKFAEDNQDIVDALNVLNENISEGEMQQMNFEVDNNGLNEKEVAKNFLKEKGLIK